jgi:hypothetical protein
MIGKLKGITAGSSVGGCATAAVEKARAMAPANKRCERDMSVSSGFLKPDSATSEQAAQGRQNNGAAAPVLARAGWLALRLGHNPHRSHSGRRSWPISAS